jgi:hypothetical protein
MDFTLYTLTFAAVQGNMQVRRVVRGCMCACGVMCAQEVWEYTAAPGGPIRQISTWMPELAAVPGVHAKRNSFYTSQNTPILYVPAASMFSNGFIMPGDPTCWTKECKCVTPLLVCAHPLTPHPHRSLPCTGIYAAQCERDFTGVRSKSTFAYNFDQKYAYKSRNPHMRNGPLYNMLFDCPQCTGDTYRMSQNAWLEENPGASYDANEGGNSIAEWLAYIVKVNGRYSCAEGQATSSPGDFCTLLKVAQPLIPDLTGKHAYMKGTLGGGCRVWRTSRTHAHTHHQQRSAAYARRPRRPSASSPTSTPTTSSSSPTWARSTRP